jgi:hypothetical protein
MYSTPHSNFPISRRRALAITWATLVLTVPGARVARAGSAIPPSKPGAASMSESVEQVSKAYIEAWSRKELEGIAARVHAEIVFKSPNAETRGRDAYLAAVARMLPLLERIDVRAQFASGDRAMLVYDFVCRAPIGIAPTAELLRIEDTLIRESELFFDPRPFEAFARARAATKGST